VPLFLRAPRSPRVPLFLRAPRPARVALFLRAPQLWRLWRGIGLC
jgi:hypothetical protein